MRLVSMIAGGEEIFVFLCGFADKHIPKNAGFQFNFDAPKEERWWFTRKIEVAARLRAHASGELRQRLDRALAPRSRLSHIGGRFVFECDRKEGALAKGAGFFRDPEGDCWYTTEPDRAAALIQFATDDCRALLLRLKAEFDELVELSRATDADIHIPKPAKLTDDYLPYQRGAVAYARRVLNLNPEGGDKNPSRGVLFADEMGLGKTIEAIATINYADATVGKLKKILIVCPSSLKINWSRELHKWLAEHRMILTAESKTSKWKFERADISICNYDILPRIIRWHKEGKEIVVDDLGALDQPWDMVVSDEIHVCLNITSQRAAMTYALLARARYKVAISGTPMLNRVSEFYYLLNALDPETWSDYWRFIRRYGDTTDKARLNELQRKLRGTILCRRLKEQVLTDLPPKRRQIVEFAVEGSAASKALKAELAAHNRYEAAKAMLEDASKSEKAEYAERVATLKQGVTAAFAEMSRLRHETALVKVPFVIEHIKSLVESDPAYKVVVMAWHTDVINQIASAFGSRAVIVTGEVSSHVRVVDGKETTARMEAVDRFQTDASCQVFVGNIQAAGVGLTLTASAHVVFAELDWVPSKISQAEDRCIAEGQLILTPDGWRKVEDIKVGDFVIGASGQPRKVLDAWSAGSLRNMTEINVKGWLYSLVTTFDHPYLTESGWKQAVEIVPGDRILMPSSEDCAPLPSIPFPESCRLPEDFFGAWGHQKNGRLIKVPDEIQLTEDALYTFGFYVGNGFVATGTDKGRFVGFATHARKTDRLNSVRRFFDALGISVSDCNSSAENGYEIRAYSGEMAFFFREMFGKGARNKKLPDWIYSLSREQSKQLLEGLTASDGYERANRVEYFSVSRDLIAQVAMVMRRCGYRPCITHARMAQSWVAAFTRGSYSDEHQSSLVKTVTHRYPQKVNRSKREKVYDLTVEADESFVVGMSVVHNCHRVGQRDSVLVQHLVLEGSLDASMARVLIEKQEILEKVLDHADAPPQPKLKTTGGEASA